MYLTDLLGLPKPPHSFLKEQQKYSISNDSAEDLRIDKDV